MRSLAPVITTGVVGLAFNTLCLKNVDTSFFIIARGLALPFTIIISSIANSRSPRPTVLLAAFVVTAGFFVGVNPASLVSPSWTAIASNNDLHSILYGIMSSFTLALHAVLVKSAQVHVGGSVTKLSYYTQLLSSVMIIPLIVGNNEILAWFEPDREWIPFFVGCIITGFFGFLLGISAILSIKVTSPVAHMFSSAARSVLQTVLGMYIFGDIIKSNTALSIFMITVGALYYTYVQSKSKPTPPVALKDPLRVAHTPKPSVADIEKGNLLVKGRS